MIEICKKQDCVGCFACISACKTDAVSMQPDSLGFFYPVINPNKCIDCGLCVKSCFNNNKLRYNEPVDTFVGHAIKKEEQLSSTSGGLASVFMRTILNGGGVVYGCSGENAREVKHIRIEHSNDINKLKGSKYVQSYMGFIYKKVVQDLKEDKTVLFIGTPCQIAGLKSYLKGNDYENLFTVDFVCHGVPSQQILNGAIDENVPNKYNLHLVNRVKEDGKNSKYTMRLLDGNEIVYDQPYPSMGYITGFLSGLYYRESCYQCKFARRERVSDITLGDFWDKKDAIENLTNKKDGLSMIMVNTNKGRKLMDLCMTSLECVAWDYEDFIKRNGQLKRPISRHANRALFKEYFVDKGFKCAINVALKGDLKRIRKSLFLSRMISLCYKIPLIKVFYGRK